MSTPGLALAAPSGDDGPQIELDPEAVGEPEARSEDDAEDDGGEHDPVASGDDQGSDADEAEGEGTDDDLLDPAQCPALFGDPEDHRYNARVRKAKLTWLETRGDVVEITHTTDWSRPFYVEFAGIELLETEVDARGRWSAVVEVDDAVPGCPPGQYAVEPDDALGKQAQVLGITDGALLVEFEGDLAYLMTADAEIPTWQMVWRSGWYFVRRREVSATKSKRSRARTNRNRSKRNRRNRNRRSRRR